MSKVKIVYSAVAFSAIVALILFTGSKQDLINKNTLAYSNLKDVGLKLESSKKEYNEITTIQKKKIEETDIIIKNQNENIKKNEDINDKQKTEIIDMRYEMSIVSSKYKNLNTEIDNLNKNKINLENEIKLLTIEKANPKDYKNNNHVIVQNNNSENNSQYSIEYQKVMDLRNEATIVYAKLMNIKQSLSIEERKYNDLKLKNAELELKIKKNKNNQ